ncbi:MAG: alpha/beta-hydrolase family protein [Acidimicrobiia bacterium]
MARGRIIGRIRTIKNVARGLTGAVLVKRATEWANPVTGSASAPLETAAFIDSFGPSLMPHSSMHQGMIAGMSVLAARGTMAIIESLTGSVVNDEDPLTHRLLMRSFLGGVGYSFEKLPVRENEPLSRSGARTAGRVLKSGSIGGAIYDIGTASRKRYPASSMVRPAIVSAAALAGILVWSKDRLDNRKAEIERWPIPQPNELLPAVATGMVVTSVGMAGTRAFQASRGAWIGYFGDSPTKRLLARAVNIAVWSGAISSLYNGGIGYIGRGNERVEGGYSVAPTNRLLSGSPESIAPFADLGQQGRRFVTDVLTPEFIDEKMGEEGAEHPIRVFIGYNSEPLYPSGRAEMALDELERTGAFDRDYLLLVSPTGTGWVDQTMIESAELFTRGNIATCCIQYGKYPSFLSLQKVALGRAQFRLLLWGIKQRLSGRPPEDRPKVLVFGESLGAWTSSDVVMHNGMAGFDHYGIDKALWAGLPRMAKWSKSGMGRGASKLVPEGTVGVFDQPEDLAALSRDERRALRAVILSHDNDPIAVMGPDLLIREPEWLKGGHGRGVPPDMAWTPIVTGIQVMIDAANAMVTVPGHFGSFGHDYRADMARMVLDGLDLPAATEEQVVAVEHALVELEINRSERVKAAKEEQAPAPPSRVVKGVRVAGGVPLAGDRTSGAQWLRSLARTSGVPVGDVQ